MTPYKVSTFLCRSVATAEAKPAPGLAHLAARPPKQPAPERVQAAAWRLLGISNYLDLQSMAKIMDPLLPILAVLGYWAIILGSFGGPGTQESSRFALKGSFNKRGYGAI